MKIPTNSDLYGSAQIRLAMILKKEGKTREAIANLEEAVKVKREVPGLYVVLSSLYEEEKDLPSAERILKEGMLLLPQNVDLYYSLGVLYEKTDRFEESIRQMRALLKIDPDHADALNFIGYSYADRGINLGEAEKMIQKALQLKPGNGYMIDSLGWTYFKQKRIDLSIQYLKEASSLLPDDGAVAEHLGDAYLKAGRRQEALESYQRALKFNPTSSSLPKKIADLPKK
jgi:tetratricopeptide (TPR) repeat protein